MGSRTRHRRRQLDRAGIAERTSVSTATVDYWHLHRAKTGFPVQADTDPDGHLAPHGPTTRLRHRAGVPPPGEAYQRC